jgi:single-stranded-DNA-specific exonuclease
MNKLSINGFLWRERNVSKIAKETIKQKYQLPDLLSSAIASRHQNLSDVENFLNPMISNLMPDPYHLHDMEKATKFIAEVILNNKKIAIFGDYDVDGATSTALLLKYFDDIGVKSQFHIPDRIKEGYGPNQYAMQKFKDDGVDLCILLDCGTVAYVPLQYAASIGLDVIVVDHHISSEILPEAIAVINPNRYDQNSPCTNLAAVGVTFLLAVALNRYFDEEINFFQKNKIKKPDLKNYLDLVALGTVCDIVPINGLNRAFVKQGLKVFNKSKNVGINAMIENLKSQKRIDVGDLGFAFGPRINAGGRIGDSSLGAKLLTCKNLSEAYEMAEKLTELNEQRKLIEAQSLKVAIKLAEMSDPKSLVMVAGDWHPGVNGLIASRIKDLYNLPTMAISFFDGDSVGKASCRSIHGIDIGGSILQAREKDLVLEGGGHHMAGGFSVEVGKIDELKDFFESMYSEKLKDMGFYSYRDYDAKIEISSLNVGFYEELEILKPFGQGNPYMKFVIENVNIYDARNFGQNHITCKIRHHNREISQYLKCNAFGNAIRNPNSILLDNPKNVSILGSMQINQWNGNEYIEFLIDDVLLN